MPVTITQLTATSVKIEMTVVEPTTDEDGNPLNDLVQMKIFMAEDLGAGVLDTDFNELIPLSPINASSPNGGGSHALVLDNRVVSSQAVKLVFRFYSYDSNGNVSAYSEDTAVLDRVAPNPPTV